MDKTIAALVDRLMRHAQSLSLTAAPSVSPTLSPARGWFPLTE
jgi:hypothetical protein